MENYFGIATEEEGACLKESHFICRQLDVMGIQISALGKWRSLFQFVVNCFGVFSLKNFVCSFGMSLTGRLLSFVRFKPIVFPIYSGFKAI